MKKRIIRRYGKEMFLLGKNTNNERVYLEKASWDCGWYWGFGYLETLNSHTHFDTEILRNEEHICAYDKFKKYFVETCLSDNEIWQLCDYMYSFYTLRESAELFGYGYSHQTEKAKIDEIKNTELVDKINKEMLPKLFEKIYELLTPKED